MKFNIRHIFCAFLFTLFHCLSAWSQAGPATAEIRGTIVDPSGAAIPGASVTVVQPDKGFSRLTISGPTGQYRFLALMPDEYSITVRMPNFATLETKTVVTVGQTAVINISLPIEATAHAITVTPEVESLAIDQQRSQQSNTMGELEIRSLPIDRRDYLTFALLAPGVTDSNALADNSDFRVAQAPQSGLSFYGNNGRGNSVSVDGAEANDLTGGVRFTLSQDAIQEFQINRSNYNAEIGGASGGVINVVSKSGTNEFHGSVFGFFRHQALDAADPFALNLTGSTAQRIKPPSRRQQYGATLSFPLSTDRTFVFASYEGLNRKESSSVSVLTDTSIFDPTPGQRTVIDSLLSNPSPNPISCLPGSALLQSLPPSACGQVLAATLSSKPSTVDLFRTNSGVFPFDARSQAFSVRIDHKAGPSDPLVFRSSYQWGREDNQSTRALVGFSRSINSQVLDSNSMLGWTHIAGANDVNELRVQWNYRKHDHLTNDPYGPEINIPGYGFFNRDINLPNYLHHRRYEITDNWTHQTQNHRLKFGGSALFRAVTADPHVFLGGSFTFSELPGIFVSPTLGSLDITSLQAFDLGIPVSYAVGFGTPRTTAVLPYLGAYAQDTWNPWPTLTLNLGLRYEYDKRMDPLPTDKNNFGPRFGFGWDPAGDAKTTVRGGYGIYYAQTSYALDFIGNTISERDGYRPIAQVLSVLDPSDPFAINGPINIFQTLKAQGVIGIPTTTRQVQASDLSQFGITVSNTGPRPPLTLLFQVDPNFRSSYSEQASLGIERRLGTNALLNVNYLFTRTMRIVRSRDVNLLPAPKSALGFSDWSTAPGAPCSGAGILNCFRDPLLLGLYNFESTANANYNAMVVEARRDWGNLSINANYTLSKALDDVTDFNYDFAANDQSNLRAEHALSSFDVRHKLVVYGSLRSPLQSSSARGISKMFADFDLSPVFRANSARPFNLLAGVDLNSDRKSTTDRPFFAGRNTGIGPNFWTMDMRLTRNVRLSNDKSKLELMVEAFNLFNRLNYASVNNTVGPNFAGPFHIQARTDVSPSVPLGMTSAFDARRFQIGVRLTY